MATPTSNTHYPTTSAHQPDPSQRERTQALRRFNWLAVYLPIIAGGILILVLTGLLIWGALSPRIEGTAAFASGLADLTLILFMLPMMVLCAIGPAALIGLIVYAVKRRRDQKDAPPPIGDNRIQRLFWRLDNLLNTIQTRTNKTAVQAARPVIKANAELAYTQTLLQRIKQIFKRS